MNRLAALISSAALVAVPALLATSVVPLRAANPPTPPEIQELVGTWVGTANWKGVGFFQSGRINEKVEETLNVTMVNGFTLRFWDSQQEAVDARYVNGYVIFSRADSSSVANQSLVGLLRVTGKDGKFKMKGTAHAADLPLERFYNGKLSYRKVN